jgi:hypothetical protein
MIKKDACSPYKIYDVFLYGKSKISICESFLIDGINRLEKQRSSETKYGRRNNRSIEQGSPVVRKYQQGGEGWKEKHFLRENLFLYLQ